MKATDLLKAQHEEVSRLFEKIEDAEEAEKVALFEELAAKLVAHDAIERQIFYPACEEQMGMDELLGEAIVEHGMVEFGLFSADLHLGGEEFEHYMMVLKEAVEHHVGEEEDEFFPQVEKAFDEAQLEELGSQMEELFADTLDEDFRAALTHNLQQVLAGAMKPKPPKKAPTKAASAKTAAKPAKKPSKRTNGRSHTARAH